MPLNSQHFNLLKKAFAKRNVLRKDTNALRLVNGQGDSLEGLVLEQYNKHFVAQIFSSFWLQELESLKIFLTNHFQVDFFIIKDRSQNTSANPTTLKAKILINDSGSKTIVQERGIQFEVDLNDTLNTGLFLDMRQNRQQVAKACKNKKVLNCFSYTCSFGVYARIQGAVDVVNVDISRKILLKGEHNYHLNQLKSSPNEFIKSDVRIYLEKAVKKGNLFDVIILDPPSFARAEGKVFSIQKDLSLLLKLALSVLNPGGRLFVSTNFSGISHQHLEETIRKSAQGQYFKEWTRLGQDVDFPGSGQIKESHLAAIWVEMSDGCGNVGVSSSQGLAIKKG